MQLIPAIDLLGGKAVRLHKGAIGARPRAGVLWAFYATDVLSAHASAASPRHLLAARRLWCESPPRMPDRGHT